MGCRAYRFLLISSLLVLFPGLAWPQHSIPANPSMEGNLGLVGKQEWHIFGRVTSLSGEPIRDAAVRVNVGFGIGTTQNVQTTIKGEFKASFNLDASLYKSVTAKVTVNKPGFLPAQEIVDFGSSDKTWGIDVVMREKAEDPDQLPEEALVKILAPGAGKSALSYPDLGVARKDLQKGEAEFLDNHNSAGAIAPLAKVVKSKPDCIACRNLLALAMIDGGSWGGALAQISEAAKLAEGQKAAGHQVEPLIMLGVLESWRREDKKAAGFFTQALEVEPQNALALQEFGRMLILQKNWEAADQQLEKALKSGAGEEARLLRVRALLEEGDLQEASAEMDKYLGGRDIRDFSVAVRTVYSDLQTRLDLSAYTKVKSLVSEPVPQVVKAFPELKGLKAEESTVDLTPVLRQVGEHVQAFFRSFPNTVSLEEIRQERLGKEGKVKDFHEQKFQYLFLAKPEKWGLGLEEYRTDARGSRTNVRGLESGFMLTTGFVSDSLLFHPDYQAGATFRYLGRQNVDGSNTYVVAFAQRPDKAQMVERFNADETSVLVLLQGIAWIDPESYRIVRIRTDLLKPQSQIRLQRQTTEIRYDQVQFREMASSMWLPREVTVTVEWKGRTYHNLHRYSDYKLFNIETKEKSHPLEPSQATPPSPN